MLCGWIKEACSCIRKQIANIQHCSGSYCHVLTVASSFRVSFSEVPAQLPGTHNDVRIFYAIAVHNTIVLYCMGKYTCAVEAT